jgi:hypothetical protein
VRLSLFATSILRYAYFCDVCFAYEDDPYTLQLGALWQNAKDCVNWAHHHNGEGYAVNLSSEDYVRHKYQRALAQFHFMGAQQSRVAIQRDDVSYL